LLLLALLLLGLGLFLPAIAKVRAAAARTQSQNNMKQIGLALHNYHDVTASLPPGVDGKNYSAAAYLLPYIEQANVYKLIDFKKTLDDKDNAQVREVFLKVFISPLDPVFRVNNDSAPTNYLFSAGSKAAVKDNDGLLYLESKVKFPDVTDGLSNTLMVGETLKGDGGTKALDARRQHVLLDKAALKGLDEESGVKEWKGNEKITGDRCASWLDGRFLQGTFTGTRVPNDERPDVSCGGEGGLSALRSVQPIINVGFGDGSVRTITKKISLETWKALTTRNGGEVINVDF
jgi:hypothetical protein